MKRIRLIIILFALAVLGFLAFAIFHDREPRYQGRTLSEWIDRSPYAEGDLRFLATNSHWQAVSHNVKQMAPEAIPLLLKWVQARDSSARLNAATWVNDHEFLHLHIKTAWEFNREAMQGFLLLGNAARPAWPTLIQLTQGSEPDGRVYSLICLFNSGADKDILLPVLLRMIHDPDKAVRIQAANMFHSRFPQEAEAAGVYKMFPRLKNKPTEPPFTNQLQNK